MSTRRARIKAVASLPVRRKNAETKPALSPKSSTSPRVHKSPRPQRPPASPCASTRTCSSNKTPLFVSGNESNIQPSSPLISVPSPQIIPPSPKLAPPSPQLVPPSPQFVIPSPQPHLPSPQRIVPDPQVRHPSCKVVDILPPSPKRSRNISCTATTPQSLILKNVLKSPALPPEANSQKSALEENDSVPISTELNNTLLRGAENRTSTLNKTPKSDKSTLPAEKIPFRQYTIEASKPPKLTKLIVDGIDGIVPLQAPASRPVHLLKDEIISETAEVVFDPIVPLPSPTRIRPKLRPTPRLGYPHRRNSVQGSASESDDERGKMPKTAASSQHSSYSRDRTESVCSVAPSPAVTPAPLPAATPAPSLVNSAAMHSHSVRREKIAGGAAAGAGGVVVGGAGAGGGVRRRVRPRIAPRQPLTMYDLIFYNPTTNPLVEKKEVEEEVKELELEEAEPSRGVPQLKLGPNGEIVLDEKSLVIANRSTACKIGRAVGGWGAGAGRYKRGARSAEWSDGETVRFYRALAALGTDFTLMASLFPNRSRKDLKIKFKKEERVNLRQVEAALAGGGGGGEDSDGEGAGAGAGCAWDAARLMQEFAEERRAALPPAPAPAPPARRAPRPAKMGLAGRSMFDTMLPTGDKCGTAAALVQETRSGARRRKPRASDLRVTYKPTAAPAPAPAQPVVTATSTRAVTSGSGKISIPIYDSRTLASARPLIPVISSHLLNEHPAASATPTQGATSTQGSTPTRASKKSTTPGSSVIVTYAPGTFLSPRAPRAPPTPGSQPKPLRPIAASATVPAWRRLLQGGAGALGGAGAQAGAGGALGGLSGVEPGSLVVLSAPTTAPSAAGGGGAGTAAGAGGRTLLQTYVAGAGGALEPVALPPALLPSLLAYMRPHASPAPSPGAPVSPASPAAGPRARSRHDSYNITHL